VGRRGDSAVRFGEDVIVGAYSRLTLTDADNIFTLALLDGPGIEAPSGVVATRGAFDQPLAGHDVFFRAGDPVPGLPDDIAITGSFDPLINASGDIALLSPTAGDLPGDSFHTAIVRSDETGAPRVLAYSTQQAPGLVDGVTLRQVDAIRQNGLGRVTFSGRLRGDGIGSSNDRYVYVEREGGPELVARENAQAPGFAPGVILDSLSNVLGMSDSGSVVVRADLDGPGVSGVNDEVLLLIAEDPAGSGAIAREDQPVPGRVDTEYRSFGDAFVNSRGDIAFGATVHRPLIGEDVAVITRDTAGTRALAIADDPVPALGDDTFIRSIDLGSLTMNENGQIAFYAEVFDGAVISEALFATDPTGELRLVVAEDAPFDIDPDPNAEDFRTVRNLVTTRDFSLNDNGEIAFWISTLGGGSGLYVANVPAPSALGVLVAAPLLSGRRRRA
jgi:hypothetical protein